MTRIWLVAIAVPTFLLSAVMLVTPPKKLVYNSSESAPIGFYWVDQRPVQHGDFVLVRVPAAHRDLTEGREYLPLGIPLLKRVVGLEGDQICRFGQAVTVNRQVSATALARDSLGRDMPQWQGCRLLAQEEVFLLQDHPQSFDGRYLGPVDRRLIIGRAIPLRPPWRKHGDS